MAEVLTAGYGLHSFLWSEKEYQPRQLVDDYQHLLPFVAMVTQGYSGKDELFPSDQMYWLRDIAYQRRVVCRASNGKYYSIPLCYRNEVIPLKRNGIEGPLMSVKEMVLKGIYTSFTFESGCWHSIVKNGDRFQHRDLKTLTVGNTYYERFLVAHSLLSGTTEEPSTHQTPRDVPNNEGVHSKFTVIPLAAPIGLVVAVGMSESESENFHRSMFNLREFVDTLPSNYDDTIDQLCDIMVFDEVPSDGDFERMHSFQFLRQTTNIQDDDVGEEYWTIDEVTHEAPKNKLAITECDVSPDRPPKPGRSKKSILSSLQAVPNLFKKKGSKHKAEETSTTKSALKNRAPSPPSDLSEDSDEMDYEEIQIEEEPSYIEPGPSTSRFIPTPLEYREEPIALGVDVDAVLGQLSNMLLSGVIPKSTKHQSPSKAKVVIAPDILPRAPMVSEIIEYEQVNTLLPPPLHKRQPHSASSTGKNRMEASHEKVKLSKLDDSPRSQYPTVKAPTQSTQHEEPISVVDILHSKLTLNRVAGDQHGTAVENIEQCETDVRSAATICGTSSRRGFADNPVNIYDMTESLNNANPELKSNKSMQKKSPPSVDCTQSNAAANQDSPVQNELKSLLSKRRETIQKTNVKEENIKITATKQNMSRKSEYSQVYKKVGLTSKSSSELGTKDTKRVLQVEPHDSTVQLEDDPGVNIVRHTKKQVHTGNVAIIHPQAKAKLGIPPKNQKPTARDQPKTTPKTSIDSDASNDVDKPTVIDNALSDDISSGADIPKDVSSFTVGDVVRCLELLNMSEYVDEFVSQQIDGALLQVLDETILQNDFGFKRMAARKLVMFARDGWRPKV